MHRTRRPDYMRGRRGRDQCTLRAFWERASRLVRGLRFPRAYTLKHVLTAFLAGGISLTGGTFAVWYYFSDNETTNPTDQSNRPIQPTNPTIKDTLIVYAYFENDLRHKNAKFFFDHGYSSFADVYFVEAFDNFEDNARSSSIEKELPLWIKYRARENVGRDFCSWSTTLNELDIEQYKFFIFMNASVRGPFIAPIFLNGVEHIDWTRLFTRQIDGNNKLIGTSINCRDKYQALSKETVHLQSMFLVTDSDGVQLILKEDQWTCKHTTREEGIRYGEVGLSRMFIKHGFNLVSQMQYWDGHDFRNKEATMTKCNAECPHGQGPIGHDNYFEGGLCGFSLNPWEMVFFKMNRAVSEKQVAAYTEWTDHKEKSESKHVM